MNWLAWIVLAVLVVAAAAWLMRRFRTEGRRIDGMMRDFDRENPRQEPGSRCVLEGAQVTGYPHTQLPLPNAARQHPSRGAFTNGCAQAPDVALEHP